MKWIVMKKDISRKNAKLILKYMREIIDEYGFVSLADVHDLMGSRVSVYTDNKKIWRSLIGARVSLFRRKGRYRIKLPAFEELI